VAPTSSAPRQRAPTCFSHAAGSGLSPWLASLRGMQGATRPPSMGPGRDNTRDNIHCVHPSSASTKPPNLDDLDAPGSIYTGHTRLRALWTVWSVEVRVLSGGLEKPRPAGLFLYPAGSLLPSGDGRAVVT
jgi:hypothetical protein